MNVPVTTGTDTLAIDIDCPPELADYLGEMLWVVSGVQSVMALYSNPNAAETTAADLDTIRVLATPSSKVVEDIRQLFAGDETLAVCRVRAQDMLAEKDWAEHWKQYWHVTPVTERITICPSWERAGYTEKAGEIVIELDPGSAFGTGAHETTSLMLKAIELLSTEKDFAQCSILDVGTGSGILAIACAKLGCKSLIAIDICENSVAVTKENARINGVDQFIAASAAPLAELCQTRHEIVLANIIAPVILELLPEMTLRLADHGVLALSGLIGKNIPDIESALRQEGFTHTQELREGDWYALIARR